MTEVHSAIGAASTGRAWSLLDRWRIRAVSIALVLLAVALMPVALFGAAVSLMSFDQGETADAYATAAPIILITLLLLPGAFLAAWASFRPRLKLLFGSAACISPAAILYGWLLLS